MRLFKLKPVIHVQYQCCCSYRRTSQDRLLAIMEALSRPQPWKNKRKRSLYVEEGYAGFIYYRKGKAPRGEEEVCDKEKAPVDGQAENIQLASVSNSASDDELVPLAEEVTESAVEVKSFVEQVKKELLASGLEAPEGKLQEAVEELIRDLNQSGSYTQFLEASEEEDKLPPHPMDAQLAKSVMEMKQKMEMYQREIQEWGSLMERKKSETERAKQDTESNRVADFNQLLPEDEATLRTHLTEEQREWLDRAGGRGRDDSERGQQMEEELKMVTSKLDRELGRIQGYCGTVLERCAAQTIKLSGNSLPTETPRTLFRAFKDAD